MNNNKLIILDFDHCIFNTTLFVKALQKKFKEDFGVSEEDFMKYRQAVKDCCYVIDIDTFVDKMPHKDKKELHKAIHEVIKSNSSKFIFNDVKPFIERYKNEFDIIILTHGDKELQFEKINHSGLPSFLKFKISLKTKDEVLKEYVNKYKETHFIDDKAENIDLVKTVFPSIKTYFIVRPEDSPYGDKQSTCDCADNTIKSLDEIKI